MMIVAVSVLAPRFHGWATGLGAVTLFSGLVLAVMAVPHQALLFITAVGLAGLFGNLGQRRTLLQGDLRWDERGLHMKGLAVRATAIRAVWVTGRGERPTVHVALGTGWWSSPEIRIEPQSEADAERILEEVDGREATQVLYLPPRPLTLLIAGALGLAAVEACAFLRAPGWIGMYAMLFPILIVGAKPGRLILNRRSLTIHGFGSVDTIDYRNVIRTDVEGAASDNPKVFLLLSGSDKPYWLPPCEADAKVVAELIRKRCQAGMV